MGRIYNATWSHVAVTLAGSPTQGQATIYVDGVPSGTGSGGSGGTVDDSAQIAYLANATYGDQASAPLNGSEDEFRISNVIRSADWIATEYNNQSSPSTFYALNAETDLVIPSAVTLYASQSQQFAVPSLGLCGSANITWAISPAGVGTVSATGLYTAPDSITTQQTVTVSATNLTSPSQTGTATVTLMPPVSVTPASATLYGGQTQQFTAAVMSPSNTAVTWTISPAGVGTISVTGLYTAPASISTQEAVTVTATVQTNTIQSASATVTLMPSVSVSITPPSAALYGGQTQQFTAAVANISNQAVTWAYTETTNFINYPSAGSTAASLALNGGATVTSGGLLQLTDGGGYEARSAWFATRGSDPGLHYGLHLPTAECRGRRHDLHHPGRGRRGSGRLRRIAGLSRHHPQRSGQVRPLEQLRRRYRFHRPVYRRGSAHRAGRSI